MITLLCEDSIDGVFSGIYEAWAGKYNRNEIVLRTGEVWNYELFMEYKKVPVSLTNSCRVGRSLRKLFGEDMYESICYALWTKEKDKADAVYRVVKYGIEHKFGKELEHHLTHPDVRRVFELGRSTGREICHHLGFTRFSHLENDILYARIEARCYVLEAVAPHFADRIPCDNWIIHDVGYDKAAVHPAGREWFVADGAQVEDDILGYAEGEGEFRQLWEIFCSSITIESRVNPQLQRQNLPLRFRNYIT